eukprot:TRINITY_DN6208_c0_g1_i1.p1 TRINITY_DN6208_c0_g1~~TRINITY_DN6208_c0_g1_i1.p1  ORF type:complete len:574 (-),score=145.92 TRINITY_DN6208_c0_g1_i1:18-1739(-)
MNPADHSTPHADPPHLKIEIPPRPQTPQKPDDVNDPLLALESLLLLSVVVSLSLVGFFNHYWAIIWEMIPLWTVTIVALYLQSTTEGVSWSTSIRFRSPTEPGILLGVLAIPFSLLVKYATTCPTSEPGSAEIYREFFWFSSILALNAMVSLIYSEAPHFGGSIVLNLAAAVISSTICSVIFGWSSGITVGIAAIVGAYLLIGLLRWFPTSFTFAEAFLISQMIVMYSIWTTFRTISVYNGDSEVFDDDVGDVIAGMILGVLAIAYVVSPILKGLKNVSNTKKSTTAANKKSAQFALSATFYASVGILILAVSFWVQYIIGQNPFLWVFPFLIENVRFLWIIYWGCLMVLTLGLMSLYSGNTSIPKIIVRKFFHALALAMFVPVFIYEENMMRLSFGVAVSGFMLIEMLRYSRIPPFGAQIDGLMKRFIDKRDSGDLVLTHTYLLLGCAIPLWINPDSSTTSHCLARYSGLLILGVGDSMASIVGVKIGRTKFPGTKKSVEGTLAAIISVFGCGYILCGLVEGYDQSWIQWAGFGIATALACLVEAFMTQIDNLFLPIYFEAFIVLFQKALCS